MSSNSMSSLQAVTPGIVPVLPVVRPVALRPLSASETPPVSDPPANTAGSTDALQAAVSELNQYVGRSRTDLHFKIDDEAGRVVVSIVDAESGQVLRQMPSEEALRIARYLEGSNTGLLSQQA